jgi:hypothetical protein
MASSTRCPIQLRKPNFASASMTTKRLAKKIKVVHSTRDKMLSISSLSVNTSKTESREVSFTRPTHELVP